MDIGRSVQYVFQDPNWIKKVLIGGLLSIIPIIGWLFVAGFFMRTVQNIIRGSDVPLPEWDQFGDDFVRGLKLVVVMIVWFIPVWVLSVCAAILGAVDDGLGGGLLNILLQCVSFIYSIAFAFILPLIVSRVAMTEQIADGFQVSAIIQEAQRIPAQLLIFVVMYFVTGFVAGFGIILCFIGVFFTSFIAYLVIAHLVGQIRTMLDGGTPETAATPPPAV